MEKRDLRSDQSVQTVIDCVLAHHKLRITTAFFDWCNLRQVPRFHEYRSLKKLYLNGNKLTHLNFLLRLPNLEKLDVKDNWLVVISPHIVKLNQLRDVRLGNNKLARKEMNARHKGRHNVGKLFEWVLNEWGWTTRAHDASMELLLIRTFRQSMLSDVPKELVSEIAQAVYNSSDDPIWTASQPSREDKCIVS
jgi:Leucine-rich repeat (LRR) protein